MKSTVIKRSVMIGGRKTSVSLENPFWELLKNIAERCNVSLGDLVGKIDSERHEGNLSSAIRLFVLDFCREEIAEQAARERTREVLDRAVGGLAHK